MRSRYSAPRGWLLLLAIALAGVRPGMGLDPHRQLGQYGRQSWGTERGLPQNTVRAVAQTRDGFVWVGTDDGLARFDGSEFRVFTVETTPELGSSSVRGLTADRAGRLWVVTTAGLAVGGPDGFRRMGEAEGLPREAVRFVHEDSAGELWVATAGGLCVLREPRCEEVAALHGRSVLSEGALAETGAAVWVASGAESVLLDRRSLRPTASLQTVDRAPILAQVVGPDGSLLVGTDEGLQVERNGSLHKVEIAGASGGVAVQAMVQGPDGTVWLGTSAGLARGNANHFALVDTGAVQRLFLDRQGRIWVGRERGVEGVVDGRVDRFRPDDPLAGTALLGILEDREGNVWLGTEADGLTMLRGQKFVTYTTNEGLSGNVVRSVLEDARGTVWVGTDGAGLNRRTADGFAAITLKEGLSSNVVLALASSANGDVWVGTPTGLNRVRGGAVKVFTTADGLADDYVRSLLVDRRGDVWVGTRHGLTRMSAAGMTTFTAMDGLGSDFIGVMMEASDGDLWVGTSGGLSEGHQGRFRNFTVKDGLPSDVVTAILPSSRGGLWLGTDGSGLNEWAGPGKAVMRVEAKKLPLTISGVLEDGMGRLWVSSRSGIFRLDAGGRVTAYDTSDGMRVREGSSGGHPVSVRTRDGRLWFATPRGVTVVDPAHLEQNIVPPLVAVERVLVNDQPMEHIVGKTAKDGAPERVPEGELVLAPGPQRVEFQFAGLSFVAPQKVRYRYRLEGFDREWVDGGTRRAAFYTNLRPGRYVFRVAAANNDGVWSETDATVALRVEPFYWQTWWFYGLLLLAAGGVAYGVYTRRVQRVKARYQGVMEERGRIAREIHDGLAQGIVSISLQLELVTRLLGTSVEAAQAQLEQAKEMVRQSLAEARSSIWELREHGTAELPARLGESLKALTGPAGMAGHLTVTGTYRAMARPVEDELLRIAQEAVTNAVRHAGGSEVAATLAYDMNRVRLEVRDDGRGFQAEAQAPAGHFGLVGIHERAEKIGASLEVRSALGDGTVVVVELDLI